MEHIAPYKAVCSLELNYKTKQKINIYTVFSIRTKNLNSLPINVPSKMCNCVPAHK